MKKLKMRRIDLKDQAGQLELDNLMSALGNQGNVVSPKGRELTKAVFGEALSPLQVVERVCSDVRTNGLDSLLHYTKQFDKVDLTHASIRVTLAELREAHANAPPKLLETVRRIKQNIYAFQVGLVQRDAVQSLGTRGELRLRFRPIKRVGIHVPGGAAAYPSTLLMTVVPAQAAGVEELVVVMPPTPNGAYCSDMLAVCHELGVQEVYRVGGAQAIAALAYGVQGINKVDMIVGPGNMFVALAKKTVYGQVAIDCIAGPSEVVVLGDETSNPRYLAAELISQAEHSPGSSLLVTWRKEILDEVEKALNEMLSTLERGDLAKDCLSNLAPLCLHQILSAHLIASINLRQSICILLLLIRQSMQIKSIMRVQSFLGLILPLQQVIMLQGLRMCCPRVAPLALQVGFVRTTFCADPVLFP